MNKHILPIVAMTLAMGTLFTSCGTTDVSQGNTNTNSVTTATTSSGVTMDSTSLPTTSTTASMQTAQPIAGEKIVTIETNYGPIKMKFFPKEAPNTVKNFLTLAEQGFYNGLIFHRVITDFMIQGGDPEGNGTGGKTANGEQMMDEISSNLKHVYGAVAMANRGPNTASSQFYIVQNKEGTPFLDGTYTIFGQVYEGMDVVEKIAHVDTVTCAPYERKPDCDKPLKDVKMEKVTVEEVK